MSTFKQILLYELGTVRYKSKAFKLKELFVVPLFYCQYIFNSDPVFIRFVISWFICNYHACCEGNLTLRAT